MPSSPFRLLAQFGIYAALAAFIGYFATNPAYRYLPPGHALVKLSLNHAGARKGECRRRSAAEIAELAANMRQDLDCPRERIPLLVRISLDGAEIYRERVPPSGLAGDGAATVYQRFPVPAGRHLLRAELRDSKRSEGFDYEHEAEVVLDGGQNFVIDFKPETGGFEFR